MKIFPLLLVVSAAVMLSLAGCGRRQDATVELQKATVALAQPEPAPPAATTGTQAAPAAAATPAPAQEMSQAMAAYQAGNLEDAVTRLQKLRATPVLTPQQRISLNDAMAAVMGEIYALAAKGDPRAMQAVKQYEKLQTQHR